MLIKVINKHLVIIKVFGKAWFYELPNRPLWPNNVWLNDGLNIIFDKDYRYGESWKRLKIGGKPQQEYGCYCDYDCCGHTFCRIVKSYLFGFITVGHYAVNV